MLRLTLLAPDIIEAALDERQPSELGLPMLLESMVSRWDEQSAMTSEAAAAPQRPPSFRLGPCGKAPIFSMSK